MTSSRSAIRKAYLRSLLVLLGLCVIAGLCFALAARVLHYFAPALSLLERFAIWYAVGLACDLYWPIRYRSNMSGFWGEAIRDSFFVALAGPLAFFLGMPL